MVGKKQQELNKAVGAVSPKKGKQNAETWAEVVKRSQHLTKEIETPEAAEAEVSSRKDVSLGRRQGMELLQMINGTQEKTQQRDLQDAGVQQGKELLRMVSAPGLQGLQGQGINRAQGKSEFMEQSRLPQKSQEHARVKQCMETHPNGRDCMMNRSMSLNSGLGSTPTTYDIQHARITAFSTAPTAPKTVLPFMPPPLLAGVHPLPPGPVFSPAAMQQKALLNGMGMSQALLSASAPTMMPPGLPLGTPSPPPPPAFTPRLPFEQNPYVPPPPLVASTSLLSTGMSTLDAPEKQRRASLPASSSMARETPEKCAAHSETSMQEPTVGCPLSRSTSEASLLHTPDESEAEADNFVPTPCVQSWEFPLSKSEKRLLYTRLCDQERAAAVHQYNHLKRRVSMGRMSLGRPCADTASITSSESEADDDEEGQRLLAKQRELEKQLQEVRTERRLSRSSRLSLSKP